jgi:hypothetical protein
MTLPLLHSYEDSNIAFKDPDQKNLSSLKADIESRRVIYNLYTEEQIYNGGLGRPSLLFILNSFPMVKVVSVENFNIIPLGGTIILRDPRYEIAISRDRRFKKIESQGQFLLFVRSK